MTFNFIKDLTESTLIRSAQNLKKYSARDIADLTFLYFLGLQLLRSEFEGKPESINYAKKTVQWREFDNFRTSATDLYMLLYVLAGNNNESAIKVLNKQEASRLLIAELQINVTQVNQWLYNVSMGRDTSDWDKLFLMKLEAMLKIQISDYRSVRRLVNEWNDLEQAEREIAMTRLLLAFRARASRSELLPMLEKIAKINKLEVPVSINPEKPIGDKKGQSLAPIAIGAAIGAGLIASSIKNFLLNAGKAKKYTENTDLNSTSENE
jgi:hypothetical protein